MIQSDHALAPSASSRARERGVILPHTLPRRSRWRLPRRIGEAAIRSRIRSWWPQTRQKRSYPRKFFRCQKLRLGVRDAPLFVTACDSTQWRSRVDRSNANSRNACNTGVSCNVDKCRCRPLLHFLYRRVNAMPIWSAPRAVRTATAASTLP